MTIFNDEDGRKGGPIFHPGELVIMADYLGKTVARICLASVQEELTRWVSFSGEFSRKVDLPGKPGLKRSSY